MVLEARMLVLEQAPVRSLVSAARIRKRVPVAEVLVFGTRSQEAGREPFCNRYHDYKITKAVPNCHRIG